MKLYGSATLLDQYDTSYPVELEINSAEELKEVAAVTDYCMAEFRNGYTLKGVYTESHRSAADFLRSDVLYADIDNDGCTESNQYTLIDFQKEFARWEYYITTSKSHRKGKNGDPPLDRFHVLFPLENPVTDPQVMKGYLRALQRHLFGREKIDRSCLDVARKFYGNPANEAFHHSGQSIQAVVDQYWRKDSTEEHSIVKSQDRATKMESAKVDDGIKSLMIPSLDKAYMLGWFDEYRPWLNLAIALKQAGFSRETWLRYCHTDEDKDIAKQKWDTIKPDGSINGMKYIYSIHQKLVFYKVQKSPRRPWRTM